jgi:diguanylate cyclase (GGDEF)-like protein
VPVLRSSQIDAQAGPPHVDTELMASNSDPGAERERPVRNLHARLVSAAQFREALDTLTGQNVRPVSAALAILFAAHALVHLAQSSARGHTALAVLGSVSAVAYATGWVVARRRSLPNRRVTAAGAAIGLVAGVNCVAPLIYGQVEQSALSTLLAVVAVSIFARSTRLFAGLVTVITAAWFAVAAATSPLPAWEDQTLPITSAAAVSIVAHIVWRRTEFRLAETKAQLNLAAAIDDLTGVYNRRGFLLVGEEMLRQAVLSLVPVTLLFIDVDHLKVINDQAGHAAGDDVLAALGEVLRATFREADVVGRLGGDEFCVLMVGSQQHLAADRLREAVSAYNDGASASRRLMISIGEVRYLGDSRETLQELIARGDAQMYADKKRRRTA